MQIDVDKMVEILSQDCGVSCVGVTKEDGETALIAVLLLPEYEAEAVAFTQSIMKKREV